MLISSVRRFTFIPVAALVLCVGRHILLLPGKKENRKKLLENRHKSDIGLSLIILGGNFCKEFLDQLQELPLLSGFGGYST